MAIKIYTENFPEKIMQQLRDNNLVTPKDELKVIYANTFLGKIRDTNILTKEKLIHWVAKGKGDKGEKTVISFKKVKDITFEEKGIFGSIYYVLSKNKAFAIRLNRKDSEDFHKLSREIWQETQDKS